MVYVIFMNRVAIAVAATRVEAEALMAEAEVARGASARVNYRVVEVESGEFLKNLA